MSIVGARTTASLALLLAINAAPSAGQGYEQQVRGLATVVGQKLTAAGKETVAVVDFTDLDGKATWLGRFLAEEVSVALGADAPTFEVIERTQLRVLVQEHKLGASGLLDPQTARKLGQIAGVQAITTGTLTEFGDSVRLSLKVLDVNTARVIASSTVDIPKTNAIQELLAKEVAGSPMLPKRKLGGDGLSNEVTPPAGGQTTAERGYTFVLEACRNAGGSLLCTLRVTNEHTRTRLLQMVARGTRLIDANAEELPSTRVTVGGNSYSNELVPGVPTKAVVVFGAFHCAGDIWIQRIRWWRWSSF